MRRNFLVKDPMAVPAGRANTVWISGPQFRGSSVQSIASWNRVQEYFLGQFQPSLQGLDINIGKGL